MLTAFCDLSSDIFTSAEAIGGSAPRSQSNGLLDLLVPTAEAGTGQLPPGSVVNAVRVGKSNDFDIELTFGDGGFLSVQTEEEPGINNIWRGRVTLGSDSFVSLNADCLTSDTLMVTLSVSRSRSQLRFDYETNLGGRNSATLFSAMSVIPLEPLLCEIQEKT